MNTLPPGYRVSTWYAENRGTYVKEVGGLWYLDPSYEQVRTLISDGVAEIVRNYDVDGIHIADYFYPPPDPAFDTAEFKASGISNLAVFRKTNCDRLVRGMYKATHTAAATAGTAGAAGTAGTTGTTGTTGTAGTTATTGTAGTTATSGAAGTTATSGAATDTGVIFGIAPQGHIENNEGLYADVRKWVTKPGYCDYIAPQVYFGFRNSRAPYETCVDEWEALSPLVKVIVGLSVYKVGNYDENAGAGYDEWITDSGILGRQVAYAAAKPHYGGYILYSYDYLFSDKANPAVEAELAAFTAFTGEPR